jgi:hypothetical protein
MLFQALKPQTYDNMKLHIKFMRVQKNLTMVAPFGMDFMGMDKIAQNFTRVVFDVFSNKKWQPQKCSDFKDLGHFVAIIDHTMG